MHVDSFLMFQNLMKRILQDRKRIFDLRFGNYEWMDLTNDIITLKIKLIENESNK